MAGLEEGETHITTTGVGNTLRQVGGYWDLEKGQCDHFGVCKMLAMKGKPLCDRSGTHQTSELNTS